MPSKNKSNTEVRIDWMDVEALAAVMCGKTEDDDHDVIEDAFFEKFDITLEQFENVMGVLWPMLDMGISPLTETPFMGFSNRKEQAWIIKKDITQRFIASVIDWLMGDKTDIGNGLEREITVLGKPKYKITITKPWECQGGVSQ
jgi:hypothetical protein